jgi:Ca2+-binding RTX toxin-like protein
MAKRSQMTNDSILIDAGTTATALITLSSQQGTAGADTLTGTTGTDVLLGLGGADRLLGLGGTDMLFGGTGIDLLYGGAGNDILSGGLGADEMFGGAGTDTAIYTSRTTGVRVDLRGLPNTGGPQPEDRISGVENVIGGSGDDNILGSTANNALDGGGGDDLLFGEDGADTVTGAAGVDRVFGGQGADILFGGSGADFLTGGRGADSLSGGGGADQFIFGILSADDTNDVIVDFQVGIDKFVVADQQGGGVTTPVSFSTLGNGNTLVTVGSAADPFYQIEVTSLGGTISQSDIQFSFLG